MQSFYAEIIELLKRDAMHKIVLQHVKVDLAKKHGLNRIPSDAEILLHADAKDLAKLSSLITKPVRTIAGVAPLAIMTKPGNCPHGRCMYCPGGIKSVFGDVPQSYTGHEPATLRGKRNLYDAYLQVFNRLEQYTVLGHSMDKVEVIVMGGTFPGAPLQYQDEFICDTFKALNDFGDLFLGDAGVNIERFREFFELPGNFRDKERQQRIHAKLLELKTKNKTFLEAEKERNETARVRCVGLTIETKPDCAKLKHANIMLDQGCTRVELGIQSVYEDVVKKIHRGHTVKDTMESMQILKDLGFKINAHYMPGLPLTDRARDLAGMKLLFESSDFRPDMLKIYPCMVSKGTGLYAEYLDGKFNPLLTEEAASLIAEWKPFVPTYCRIQRVQRDVPTKYWAAGVGLTNLRQYIHEKLKPKCRCIRCREPRGRFVDYDSVNILTQEYAASGGTEVFISAEDTKNDLILGFCRLRIPGQCLRPEITQRTAVIRELHVYGAAVGIGERTAGNIQHRGYGRQLLQLAEMTAQERFGKNKIVVISGVGVREYYRKLGYANDGPYVSKNLRASPDCSKSSEFSE